MESKDSAQAPNYFLSPDMLSITSIRLNGSNYAQWAHAVEVFLLGRKKFDYVIKEPLVPTDPKFADWRAKDAQIRSCLWNSISLRSVVVWFSYQLLNLFGNKPRNFTLVLTI